MEAQMTKTLDTGLLIILHLFRLTHFFPGVATFAVLQLIIMLTILYWAIIKMVKLVEDKEFEWKKLSIVSLTLCLVGCVCAHCVSTTTSYYSILPEKTS